MLLRVLRVGHFYCWMMRSVLVASAWIVVLGHNTCWIVALEIASIVGSNYRRAKRFLTTHR